MTLAMPARALAVAVTLAAAADVLGAQPAPRPAAPNAADVRFMTHMIHHHAQALQMAALVPARTRRDDLRLLAERITVSQQDEIGLMRSWLRKKGQPVPDTTHGDMDHASMDHGAMDHSKMDHSKMDHSKMDHSTMDHSTMDHAAMHPAEAEGMAAAMPGMATPEELARLASLSGPEFDRLFLDLMTRHHEGALTMVADLLRAPGGAQDPEIAGFANDVGADQRAEIARMRALRRTLQ